MAQSIFLLDPENRLTELTQTPYASEDLLQRLLADHPGLIGLTDGGQGGLLLVRRELAVPEAQDGGGSWSLDHLFLDRSGVPVLVEVKRASDTRARREVVAQMLDYAANGVAYWPIEGIVQAFRETSAASSQNPDAQLAAFIDDGDPEKFWRQVDANLRSGRVRMVFVADQIPKELRRIVEFLNEQMRPAEVLAIEVEQFTAANGMRTLVPRLLGATERAQSAKSVTTQNLPISEDEWLDTLATSKGAASRLGAVRALLWFKEHGFTPVITESQDAIGANLRRPDGKLTWPFFIRRSNGKLQTSLEYLRYHPAYADEEPRAALLAEFRKIPGVVVTTTKLTGWPAIPLEDLQRPEVWSAFEAIALGVKAALMTETH